MRLSKNLTDADSAGPGVSGFIGTNSFIGQNSFSRGSEKAVSQLDTPQALVASFFYELPAGHGKRYLNQGGVVERVAGAGISLVLLPTSPEHPRRYRGAAAERPAMCYSPGATSLGSPE